jgi:hypothetical protein
VLLRLRAGVARGLAQLRSCPGDSSVTKRKSTASRRRGIHRASSGGGGIGDSAHTTSSSSLLLPPLYLSLLPQTCLFRYRRCFLARRVSSPARHRPRQRPSGSSPRPPEPASSLAASLRQQAPRRQQVLRPPSPPASGPSRPRPRPVRPSAIGRIRPQEPKAPPRRRRPRRRSVRRRRHRRRHRPTTGHHRIN